MYRELTTAFFVLVCLGGFSWQEYEISKIYFTYDVTTRVSITVPQQIDAPGLSACFRYTDILFYDKLNADKNLNFNFTLDEKKIDIIQQTLNIDDVFKYTPEGKEAFGGCRAKIPSQYQIFEGNGSADCLKMFKVYKYFFVEYMCYRYEYIARPMNFLFDELANTPKLSGVIFEITPGGLFSNYQYAKFVLHTGTVYPAKSVGLSPVMFRGENWQNETQNSATYFLSYFKLQKTRLPPPAKTNCLDYKEVMGEQSRASCRQNCIKKESIAKLQLIPFTSIQTTPTNLKAISYLDTLDDKVQKQVFDFYHKCNLICGRTDCHERTTFNRISFEKSTYLKIQIMIPEEPWIDYFFVPIMTFPEFVTYCLSCFGTWFGLSVLTLNPFAWFEKVKEKINKSDKIKHDDKIRQGDKDDFKNHSGGARFTNQPRSRRGSFSSRLQNVDRYQHHHQDNYHHPNCNPHAYDPLLSQKVDLVYENQLLLESKFNEMAANQRREQVTDNFGRRKIPKRYYLKM